MFEQARLKLTGYYLLIIMLITIFFSAVVFHTISRELERGYRRAEMHLRPFNNNMFLVLLEDLNTAKKGLAFRLFIINGIILVLSAGASYVLAGKTLYPIEKALLEQKRFVADASHELRTPLTALKTSIEVALRDKRLSLKNAKKVLKSSLADVDGLESLSTNLLSLASLQDNGHNLGFYKINLADVLKTTIKKIKPLAKKKNISLKVKVKKIMILGNQESLEKLMLILLDNAIKYNPKKGKVWVEVKKNKKSVLVSIKDTGVGIAKKDLTHIFDRFYRADQSRSKTKVDGYGLGLALAKKIVKLHKGNINAKSKLSKGTTFIIKLPG